MKPVRFTQSMMVYRRGDVAAFEDGVADRIIRKGMAEPVQESASESQPSSDAAPEPRKRRAVRNEDSA